MNHANFSFDNCYSFIRVIKNAKMICLGDNHFGKMKITYNAFLPTYNTNFKYSDSRYFFRECFFIYSLRGIISIGVDLLGWLVDAPNIASIWSEWGSSLNN